MWYNYIMNLLKKENLGKNLGKNVIVQNINSTTKIHAKNTNSVTKTAKIAIPLIAALGLVIFFIIKLKNIIKNNNQQENNPPVNNLNQPENNPYLINPPIKTKKSDDPQTNESKSLARYPEIPNIKNILESKELNLEILDDKSIDLWKKAIEKMTEIYEKHKFSLLSSQIEWDKVDNKDSLNEKIVHFFLFLNGIEEFLLKFYEKPENNLISFDDKFANEWMKFVNEGYKIKFLIEAHYPNFFRDYEGTYYLKESFLQKQEDFVSSLIKLKFDPTLLSNESIIKLNNKGENIKISEILQNEEKPIIKASSPVKKIEILPNPQEKSSKKASLPKDLLKKEDLQKMRYICEKLEPLPMENVLDENDKIYKNFVKELSNISFDFLYGNDQLHIFQKIDLDEICDIIKTLYNKDYFQEILKDSTENQSIINSITKIQKQLLKKKFTNLEDIKYNLKTSYNISKKKIKKKIKDVLDFIKNLQIKWIKHNDYEEEIKDRVKICKTLYSFLNFLIHCQKKKIIKLKNGSKVLKIFNEIFKNIERLKILSYSKTSQKNIDLLKKDDLLGSEYFCSIVNEINKEWKDNVSDEYHTIDNNYLIMRESIILENYHVNNINYKDPMEYKAYKFFKIINFLERATEKTLDFKKIMLDNFFFDIRLKKYLEELKDMYINNKYMKEKFKVLLEKELNDIKEKFKDLEKKAQNDVDLENYKICLIEKMGYSSSDLLNSNFDLIDAKVKEFKDNFEKELKKIMPNFEENFYVETVKKLSEKIGIVLGDIFDTKKFVDDFEKEILFYKNNILQKQ